VPEDVAPRRLEQMCPLANAKLRRGRDGCHAWRDLAQRIRMLAELIFQRRPLLAAGIDVLTVVLTNGAALGWTLALGILCATGQTEVFLATHHNCAAQPPGLGEGAALPPFSDSYSSGGQQRREIAATRQTDDRASSAPLARDTLPTRRGSRGSVGADR